MLRVVQPGEFKDRWGHNFDGCAPGTLIARASVKNGEIVLPDGMRYRVLVLPQVETMTPELLKKIAELAEAGATVVGMPPKASPSLSGHPDCDVQVRAIAESLFGVGTKEGTIRKVGAGSAVLDTSAYRWAQENPLADARWIWAKGSNAPEANRGIRSFMRRFRVENASELDIAEVLITASPAYEVSLNGSRLGGGNVINQVQRLDATWLIHDGNNEIKVTVDCDSQKSKPPFGVIAALCGIGSSGKRLQVVTDSSWTVRQSSDSKDDSAVELGGFVASPWNLTEASLQAASLYPPYRITSQLLADLDVKPDFEGDGMRAIHRRDGDQDIYFVANRNDRELSASWVFRVTGKQPEWWDALNGERRLLQQFEEKEGRTHVPVRLEPHQSGFVVFRSTARERSETENFPRLRPLLTLEGAWEVTFDPKWGGPGSVRFDRLEDWTRRSENGIRYYSGKAVYKIRFDAEDIGDRNLSLSLGEVRNIAAARLNGQDLGVAWCAPWRLALPERVLKARGNELEVTVANLWWNRLLRDSSLPEGERLTWIPGKYPFSGDEQLQASGLLGPVRIDIPDD